MSLSLDKSTWKRVSFGDVIDSVTERVNDPSEAGVDRYVGLEHLDPGVMTVQRWDTPDKVAAQKLRFKPKDVIFGRRRAYQKKVGLAEFEGICSAHALVLRARPEYIRPDFLPVFLSSDYFLERAIAISVGSLSPTINWRDLKIQEFELPPLDEQQRIADLLWALERHRASVTDQATVLSQVRDRWIEAGLPREVSQTSLGAVSSVVSGVTLGPARRTIRHTAPYLRVANVQRGSLDLDEIKEVGATAAEIETKGLQRGDVLVVEGHASVYEIGRAAIWDKDESPLFQNHLFRVRAAAGFRPAFLLEWINSERGRAYIRTVAKSTSGLNTINSTVLKAMPVPEVELEQQDRLLNMLMQLDACRSAVEDEAVMIAYLRSSLLADIFGGS
ncbi:type I restriction modification DNA specificity domain protein [Pseudarthrobacter siccitolerans]|uniref:Type I restriction modification DNA specificity domain protein n=1 Tax=Pseudarthrobacter siccitolerans TaxID=861266 RepID=A0A024H595_9MICC|nr:restriction endonuclease subunit S [Pseudarthrobacter siccitolerans]CCQ47178.1 type I restriction modification DNA specificity domain protein [Pseudarthrobacter siccitolerans]